MKRQAGRTRLSLSFGRTWLGEISALPRVSLIAGRERSPPQPVQSETGEERADWTSPWGGLSGRRGRCRVGGWGIVRDRIGHGATGRIGGIRGLLDGRQGGIGHAQERTGIFLSTFAPPVPRSSRRCGGGIARRSQIRSEERRVGKECRSRW